jgi:hypothetical protein
LNIEEFFGVTVTAQAIAAERVIASVSPKIFFMDVNVQIVTDREASLHPNKRNGTCADKVKILDNIGRATPLDTGVFVWPQGSMFAVSQEIRAKNVAQRHQALVAGRGFMQMFRQLRQSDAYKKNQVKNFRKLWPAGGRSTKALFSIMLDKFDHSIPSPKDNDFFDFLHACVPTSFCDVVVLDNRWRRIVDEARRALANDGIKTPMARVFSEGDNGIERFLKELGAFPPSPPLMTVKISEIVEKAKQTSVMQMEQQQKYPAEQVKKLRRAAVVDFRDHAGHQNSPALWALKFPPSRWSAHSPFGVRVSHYLMRNVTGPGALPHPARRGPTSYTLQIATIRSWSTSAELGSL